MVSRSHAEFRLSSGHYLLVDKGSTFGTFVDGRPVNGYVEVHDGMRVQFGIEGPIIRVCYVDDTDDAVAKVPSQPGISPENRDRIARHAAIQSPILRQSAEFPPTGHAIEARLEIIGEGSTPSKTFPIIKDVTRLGRDSELEVRLEASAVVVSRIHAEIRRSDGQFQLIDLNSYNGTFLNGVRISKPTELSDGDRLELGLRGPVLRFYDPASAKDEGGIVLGGSEVMAPPYSPPPPIKTVVAGTTSAPLKKTNAEQMETKLLTRRLFGQKTQIVVGRAQNSDVCLDGLLISNRHAVFIREGEVVYVEDAGSTNGVYLNGARVPGRQPVGQQDLVQIGPFLLRASTAAGVSVYDTRAKTRIDVIEVTKNIRNSIGGGTIQLLNGVSLTIRPNEFVGLLGPSGAGKSTLMDALNGMRPATSGQVLINRFDLYQHLDYLKQQIGYVPQDDIIHRELTVYRTLYYVAKLRLSGDVSEQEIDQIVSEVIDLTGLTERRAVPVSQLSGGQRKRVSIAVELIIKPAIIFLDEPTSGLDPATEEKIMVLFRQLAESGRTVILTTHAMENVKLFDKIAIMLRGRLVFYGAPHEALAYVGAESFKELYDKLEAPAVAKPAGTKVPRCGATKDQTADKIAEEWSERFKRTIQYRRNVIEPATEVVSREGSAPPRVGHSPMEAARQLLTLTHRYAEVLRRDKFNLLILFGQAPIIALLTYLVVGVRATRDFPYFMLALVAIWFGTSISAREIVRERPIYNRERMVNLKLLPYVGSKLLVLSLTVGLQCALLFGSLKLFHAAGLMELPGSYGGLPQFGLMVLTGAVGVAIGLLVSALVKTSEMATSIVPLILIPQILFSGLVGVPEGTAKIVGLAMPATWAFDGMKRLSELDVLRGRDEGGETPTKNEGRGLYKQTEFENDQNIEEAKRKIELYKADAEKSSGEFAEKMDDFQKDLAAGRPSKKPDAPKLGPAPSVGAATRVPSDLSNYIDFLHPLGGIWRNAAVLVVMFLGLTAAIIMVLRLQDIK
jgi:ABC-type multidrug transport system ATPase subunit